VRKADNLPPSCAVVAKSGNLNFLEPSGPVQACNGSDLPFFEIFEYFTITIILFISSLRVEWKELFNHLCIPRTDVHKTLYYVPRKGT